MKTSPALRFHGICLAYCLSWELAGAHAPECWDLLRAAASKAAGLTERERWTVELYEEGPPTAQEERSLLSRIEGLLRGRRQLAAVRNTIVGLLPDSLRAAAARHSLLQSLRLAQEPSVVETWLKRSGLAPSGTAATGRKAAPVAEREADFVRFLALPGFEERFRAFWRSPPKNRGNRETRALVTIGAIAGQCIERRDGIDADRWAPRFANTCHYSSQTQEDVLVIAEATAGHDYGASDLAYRLLADALPRDVRYLKDWIGRYGDEMNPVAAELLRLLNL